MATLEDRWRFGLNLSPDPENVVRSRFLTFILRQRHRFMRKGKYQKEAFGLVSCVGCGRCADACLVHITPVDTFNELYRRHKQGEVQEAQA